MAKNMITESVCSVDTHFVQEIPISRNLFYKQADL